MAAPVIASSGTAAAYGATTIAVPSGVSSGSLVVIAGVVIGTSTAPTISSPAITGFTISSVQSFNSTVFGSYVYSFWAYKYATGADSGTYSWTGSGNLWHAQAYRITGATTSGSPFVDTPKSVGVDGTGVTFTIATFTPGGNDSLIISTEACDEAWTSVPSGWTRFSTGGNGEADYTSQSTAAATGSLSWTANTTTVGFLAVNTIRPAGGGSSLTGDVSASTTVGSSVLARMALVAANSQSITITPSIAARLAAACSASQSITVTPTVTGLVAKTTGSSPATTIGWTVAATVIKAFQSSPTTTVGATATARLDANPGASHTTTAGATAAARLDAKPGVSHTTTAAGAAAVSVAKPGAVSHTETVSASVTAAHDVLPQAALTVAVSATASATVSSSARTGDVSDAVSVGSVATASVYTIPVFRFVPPVRTIKNFDIGIHDSPWAKMKHSEGVTLLVTGNQYRPVSNPSPEEIEAADRVYLGGRNYTIGQDEVDVLVAAGYGSYIEQIGGGES